MGKRGPKPKPKRRAVATAGVPECPTWLGADGKRWWAKIVKHMQELGTIAPQHGEMIAMVCSAADTYHACMRDIKKHGMFDVGSQGQRVASPAIKQANTSWLAITKGLAQLGLTPVSMGEAPKLVSDDHNPLDEFVG